MVVFSGDLDKALALMIIASGAAGYRKKGNDSLHLLGPIYS